MPNENRVSLTTRSFVGRRATVPSAAGVKAGGSHIAKAASREPGQNTKAMRAAILRELVLWLIDDAGLTSSHIARISGLSAPTLYRFLRHEDLRMSISSARIPLVVARINAYTKQVAERAASASKTLRANKGSV